jgi:NAD(P)-dependent dehydrogenase (short-subunit alcohol dehydrogenase family)
MLYVTGASTTIIRALRRMLPKGEQVKRPYGDLASLDLGWLRNAPTAARRYVFAAGVIHPKRLIHQDAREIGASLAVNLVSTVALCERVLARNHRARICVIGSASGEKGSYDTTYFLAKAALHAYVRERRLSFPKQQLVAVAPWVIGDSGMTRARTDLRAVDPGPAGRFVRAREVAKVIRFLLYEDSGFISNTVVHMSGGQFARMT